MTPPDAAHRSTPTSPPAAAHEPPPLAAGHRHCEGRMTDGQSANEGADDGNAAGAPPFVCWRTPQTRPSGMAARLSSVPPSCSLAGASGGGASVRLGP